MAELFDEVAGTRRQLAPRTSSRTRPRTGAGAQYRCLSQELRATGYLGNVKTGIALSCMAMVVLGVVVEFHPLGPPTATRMVIFAAAIASAGVAGVAWWVHEWPRRRWAVASVVWADLTIVISAACLASPAAQFGALTLVGLPGLFAALLLGRAVLTAQVAFGVVALVAFTVRTMVAEQTGLFDLYFYIIPTAYAALVVPATIQAVAGVARISIARTVTAAQQDPLTGLYNRRSLYELAVAELGRRNESVLVTAVIDVDRFKGINDRYGHSVGDAVIVEVSRLLTTAIGPTDLLGRIGGDEFAVIAFRDGLDEVPVFADRLHDAQDAIGSGYTLSIGVACQLPAHSMATLDALLRQADSAMYQAKTSGGGRLHLLPPP